MKIARQSLPRGTPGRFAAIVLAACACSAFAAPAAVPPPATGAETQATSGDERLDNAVAAVVVSALIEQFGGEAVSVRLDSVELGIASLRDRVVSGQGRMRIGDDPEWVAFRYRTLYDTTFSSAGQPELSFGGVAPGERELPNDPGLVQQLDAQVVAELDEAFGTATRLQLDRIATLEAGKRFLRIDATGMADFGPRGTAPIRIESLYDLAKSSWQRVRYDLGTP